MPGRFVGTVEVARLSGDPEEAGLLAREAADLFAGMSNWTGKAYALRTAAEAAIVEGHVDGVLSLARNSLDTHSSLGEARGMGRTR